MQEGGDAVIMDGGSNGPGLVPVWLYLTGEAEALARSHAKPSLMTMQMLMAFMQEVAENAGRTRSLHQPPRGSLHHRGVLGCQSPRGQDHQLESRMRENRTYGSEGGGG